MPNRLAAETSPYLRQHADNPVDWWPWCDQAWEQARRLDRPVLLSIGYSACHWCHVMAHESFEDPAIAALMNDLFLCIKVDREERPDVDSVYMQAVQAMTGGGGWPMTVFCTPRGVPYFGGTYLPPEDRRGMRGLPTVLRAAAEAYAERRDDVDRVGEQLRVALTPPRLRPGDGDLDAAVLDRACARLEEQTDRRDGGFGGAPKFPHPAAVDLLLRRARAAGDARHYDTAAITLDRMARGGIHDHVGGGFHRYSVDARWAVPHFEKMLYDNAQLAPVYLHAWQLSGERRWLDVCAGTLDYLLRDLRLPGGGFASSEDADSEGVEGRFYVFTPDQLTAALDEDDARLAARIFGVTPGGNFEDGATVLSLPYPLDHVAASLGMEQQALADRVCAIADRLRTARDQRVRPGRDDKVVAAWNGLALRALAECGAATGRDDWLQAAGQLGDFLVRELIRDGVVMRSWLDGDCRVRGFLEDSACLGDGLLTLYEATGEPRHFSAARDILDDMLARFHDPVAGFYDTAIDGEPLIVRPRTLDDSPTPAGQSTAALALVRLAALTGDGAYHRVAAAVAGPLAEAFGRAPLGLANLGWVVELLTGDMREVAIGGRRDAASTVELVTAVLRRWDPLRVLAWGDADGVPLLADRGGEGDAAMAYVCRDFRCDRPVRTVEDLVRQLA